MFLLCVSHLLLPFINPSSFLPHFPVASLSSSALSIVLVLSYTALLSLPSSSSAIFLFFFHSAFHAYPVIISSSLTIFFYPSALLLPGFLFFLHHLAYLSVLSSSFLCFLHFVLFSTSIFLELLFFFIFYRTYCTFSYPPLTLLRTSCTNVTLILSET